MPAERAYPPLVNISCGSPACGVGFITALSWIMVLDFPGGVLQYYVKLPWPLS